jgi:hypothetical protein
LEITRRLLGSSAIVSQNSGDRDITVSLDLDGFIRRLLLFDTYILYSVRLKEIPELVRTFGVPGTIDLLSSGALDIRCECAQFMEGEFKTPPCPPLTFQFHLIEANSWEKYLIDNLAAALSGLTFSGTEKMKLEEAVVAAVKHHDNRRMFSEDITPAFEAEVLANPNVVKAAVKHVLSQRHRIRDVEFQLKMHKASADDARYEAETDLERKANLGQQDVHHAIKAGLLGVSGMCQRIGEMKVHEALAGFTEEEMPLFRAKLGILSQTWGSEKQEERFSRVIAVGELPKIVPGQRIDAEKLLRIRDDPDAIQLRGWLADIDKLTDSELKNALTGFHTKIGLAVQSKTGILLRLLVTNGVGVLNPLAGLLSSALDSFAWEKFFRRSGVAAFINNLYPSIFKF